MSPGFGLLSHGNLFNYLHIHVSLCPGLMLLCAIGGINWACSHVSFCSLSVVELLVFSCVFVFLTCAASHTASESTTLPCNKTVLERQAIFFAVLVVFVRRLRAKRRPAPAEFAPFYSPSLSLFCCCPSVIWGESGLCPTDVSQTRRVPECAWGRL